MSPISKCRRKIKAVDKHNGKNVSFRVEMTIPSWGATELVSVSFPSLTAFTSRISPIPFAASALPRRHALPRIVEPPTI